MGPPIMLFAGSSVAAAVLFRKYFHQYLNHVSIWEIGVSLFFLQAIVFLLWKQMLRPHFFSPLRKLPSPPGGSIFWGHFRRILKEPTGVPMKEWMSTVPNDGLITYRSVLNKERVLLTNQKALAEVLTQKSYEFVKPEEIREDLGRILGVGILLAEGDEHKRQRKNLNPAFSFRHVKELYPVFWTKAREMALAMEASISQPQENSEKPSNVTDVGKWATRTTLDIIGVAGMGKDFNALSNPQNELYQTYQKIFSPSRAALILGLMTLVLPYGLVRRIPVKRNDDMIQAVEVIKHNAKSLIDDKKGKIEKGDSSDVDILSVALKSGAFTDENLVHQSMTFLAAGHETTGSAMQWAIYYLCRYPEVQKKLRQELRNANIPSVHNGNATVTAMDIENIPYLSAVCNEVLRIRPPVGLTLRKAANDTTILNHFIPKDTTIIICPYAVNHSKELWGEDAEEFQPERWMAPGCANTGGATSNYAFMTFIHGPRSCIGSSFARAEFMCLVAAWVNTFETELEDPSKDVEAGPGATSRPKGGLSVKLKLADA